MSRIPRHLLAQQDRLLQLVTERVEAAHLKAIRQGLDNPAVLVLDLSSPRARAIASASGRAEEMDRFIKKGKRAGGTPLAVWHMPGDVAANLLPPDHSGTAEALRNWSSHAGVHVFPVVVVGAGVISLAAIPIKNILAFTTSPME